MEKKHRASPTGDTKSTGFVDFLRGGEGGEIRRVLQYNILRGGGGEWGVGGYPYRGSRKASSANRANKNTGEKPPLKNGDHYGLARALRNGTPCALFTLILLDY